ncbi:hypothetical protein Gpo141_00004345 [Globisporangium polare]
MGSQADQRRHRGTFKTFFNGMGRSLFGRDEKRAHRLNIGSASQRPNNNTNHHQSSQQARLNASKAWNSQNEHFNRLKFYVWTGGSPGFTLKRIAEGEKTGQLAIKAVANLSAWSTGIRPGDILESVSGACVQGMDPEEAMSLLETSDAPVVLRFSAFTSGSTAFDFPQRFRVTLGNQRLGVQFMGDGKEAVPVVTRIPSSRIANLPAIRLGDVLVAVNHVDAIALGLEDAMAVITASPKPMKLTFQRLSSELGTSELRSTDLTAKASSSQHQQQRQGHQQHINSRRGRCSQTRSSLCAPPPPAARDFISRRSRVRSMVELGRMSATEDIDLAFADLDTAVGDTGGPKASEVIRARIGEVVLIVWREGPLGLTLFEDDISGLPLVNRLTGKGSSAGLERLQHGFLLDSVNGVKTEGQNFLSLCQGLSSMQKPVTLLFRTAPKHGFGDNESFTFSVYSSSHQSSSDQAESVCLRQTTSLPRSRGDKELRDDEYELLWHAGEKLGLVLGTQSRNQSRDSTVSAAGCDSTGQPPVVVKIQPSCPLRFQEDAMGDAIVAVNNLRTEGLGRKDVRLLLESASKPALLRFRSHNRSSSSPSCLEHRRTASLSSESSGCADSERCDFAFGESDDESDDERDSGAPGGKSDSARSFATSYNLLWSTGHLGLTFSSYEDSDCENEIVVFVKCIGRLGHAKRTRLVRVGDRLASVHGKRVEVANQRAFHELMRSLATKSKPVVLGFQRPMVEFGDESSL